MKFTRLCFASLAATMLLASQASAQLGGDGPSPAADFDVVTDFPPTAVPDSGGTFGDPSGTELNQVNVTEPTGAAADGNDPGTDALFFETAIHFTELNISDTGTVANRSDFFDCEINITGGSLGASRIGLFASGPDFTDTFIFLDGGRIETDARLLSGSTLVIESGTIGPDFESEAGTTIEMNDGNFGTDTNRPFDINGVFNLNGGTVARSGDFNAGSVFNMTGGTLGDVPLPANTADFFGIANISGGTVGPNADAEAGSTVNISGDASVGTRFEAMDGSTVNISGDATIGNTLQAFDGSTINISGNATIGDNFDARAGSVVNFDGGTVGAFFEARSGSTVTVSGGNFGVPFETQDADDDGGNAVITITGGVFQEFLNRSSATEISGGQFVVFSNSNVGQVNFTGTSFALNGEPITTVGTTIIPIDPDDDIATLTGTLLDGNTFSFDLNPRSSDPGDFFSASEDSQLSVTLVPSSALGDFDENGVVDCDDLDGYIGNLGTAVVAGTPEAALDFDGNGVLTPADANSTIADLVVTSNGITGTFLGDFNCDGTVDVLNDAFALVNNLGGTVTSYAQGDANFDGDVDVLADAFTLINNLGSTNEAPAAP